MATKTFDELKQLAIQIRDEKTNKQNTANRVGTAMLEGINKLEQDYYDKTAADKELKKRDDKLIELANNVGLYNVDKHVPLGGGFYTSATARAAVPSDIRKIGLIITYKTDVTTSVTEQFIGSDVSGWTTDANWKNVGSEGGNKILEWKTDAATTRKKVPAKERKAGMQISYKPTDSDWVNEQYVGTSFTDTEWVKDSNWEKIPKQKQLTELEIENINTDINTMFNKEITTNYKNIIYDGSKVVNSAGYKSFLLDVSEDDKITVQNANKVTWFSGDIEINTNNNFISDASNTIGVLTSPQGAKKALISVLVSSGNNIIISKLNNSENIIRRVNNTFTNNSILNPGIKEFYIKDTDTVNNQYDVFIFRRAYSISGEIKWTLSLKKRNTENYFFVLDTTENIENKNLFEYSKDNYDGINSIKIYIVIDWEKALNGVEIRSAEIYDKVLDISLSPYINSYIKESQEEGDREYLILENGMIRNNDKNVMDEISLRVENSDNPEFKYSVFLCKENDEFYISGKGSYAASMWMFLDEENRLLLKETNDVTSREKKITAPSGAHKLVVNFYQFIESYYCYMIIPNIMEVVNEKFAQKMPLYGKTVMFFGDSITEFKDNNNKRYSDYFQKMSGAVVYNAGIGGARLSVRNNGVTVEVPTNGDQAYAAMDVPSMIEAFTTKNWTKQINAAEWLKDNASDNNVAIINEVKDVNPEDVDIVVIFAGTNNFNNEDLGTAGDFDITKLAGGLGNSIKLLLETNPKISIYIFTPLPRYFGKDWSNWDNSQFSDNIYYLKEICAMEESVAKYFHIPVCDMYFSIGWNRYNWSNFFSTTNDGTHPYKGFKQIANKMLSYIDGNRVFPNL